VLEDTILFLFLLMSSDGLGVRGSTINYDTLLVTWSCVLDISCTLSRIHISNGVLDHHSFTASDPAGQIAFDVIIVQLHGPRLRDVGNINECLSFLH